MLRLRRYRVQAFSSAEAALAWPGLPDADAVVTDVKMPGMDGEEFLVEVTRRGFALPVTMITGHGDVSMAVRCLKGGAYDFVEKPFEDDVLLACVARATEKVALQREAAELRRRLRMLSPEEDGRMGMIGRSRPMLDLYEQIEALARSDAPVLIVGETGAGKELVARALHALLLDEIESIPLRAQVQLLRVLEDGLVVPLGGDKPRKVDIRLLATTKADLQDEVRCGRMRDDFYHRIAVLTIAVPPLRERREDIPLLASFFLKQAAQRNGVPVPSLPEAALADAGGFTLDDAFAASRHLSLPAAAGRLRDEMERTERAVIEATLRETGGEVGATALALGISRRALYERMRRYALAKEAFREP